MSELPALAIHLGQFILTIIVTLVSGVWWLSGFQRQVLDKVDEKFTAKDLRVFGLESKVSNIETWSRDTFLRREDFFIFMNTLSKDITAVGERVDLRMNRLEEKLDKIILDNKES